MSILKTYTPSSIARHNEICEIFDEIWDDYWRMFGTKIVGKVYYH